MLERGCLSFTILFLLYYIISLAVIAILVHFSQIYSYYANILLFAFAFLLFCQQHQHIPIYYSAKFPCFFHSFPWWDNCCLQTEAINNTGKIGQCYQNSMSIQTWKVHFLSKFPNAGGLHSLKSKETRSSIPKLDSWFTKFNPYF